ncbi:hypothetical protein F0562_008118 [Nyssa sinensis]|uniref:Uncharacterized protein n=1 Tax=Nyssa sinensis TaxID=561372 RepID=A0A5J5A8P2_9ASTE|nr:hypothetical protein F0562_008118 [Nyssa sinensis]
MWFQILTSKYSSSKLYFSLHNPHPVCLHPTSCSYHSLSISIVYCLAHYLSLSLSTTPPPPPPTGLSLNAHSIVLVPKIF